MLLEVVWLDEDDVTASYTPSREEKRRRTSLTSL